MGGIFVVAAIIFLAYPVHLLIKWLYIFLQYGREEKPPDINLSGKLHEPPSDLKPYYVDALINKTLTPSGRSVSSTLLEMVRLKFVKISYDNTDSSSGNKKKEYYLELNEEKAGEFSKLPYLEQRLLGFVFQGMGNRAKFSDIKNYHIKKARTVNEFWKYWKEEVVYGLVKMGFIDRNSYYLGKYLTRDIKIIAGFIVGMFFLYLRITSDYRVIREQVYSSNINLLKYTFLPIILIFWFLAILSILGDLMYKRSATGNTEYAKWLAFKNWMNDYRVTKNYPADSLVLWEKYLVYGVALGVSKKAISELPIKYELVSEVVERIPVRSETSGFMSGDYGLPEIVLDFLETLAFIPDLFEKEKQS